jgi:hypothetical protein
MSVVERHGVRTILAMGPYGAALAPALRNRGNHLEGGVGQPMVFRNLDESAAPMATDPLDSMRATSEGMLGERE